MSTSQVAMRARFSEGQRAMRGRFAEGRAATRDESHGELGDTHRQKWLDDAV